MREKDLEASSNLNDPTFQLHYNISIYFIFQLLYFYISKTFNYFHYYLFGKYYENVSNISKLTLFTFFVDFYFTITHTFISHLPYA